MQETKRIDFRDQISKNKIVIITLSIILLGLILFLGFNTNHDTKKLTKYETEHFDIYYSGLEQETLNDIEYTLENTFNESGEFFGYINKSEVVVYSSNKEFQRNTYGLFVSLFLGDWAVGAAVEDKIFITSPENPDKSHSYEDMLEILSHEYVHTQIWKISKDVNIWLDEGLATYFAGQKGNMTFSDVPSFEEINSNDINDFVNAEGYTFCYYYVEYLIDNYSKDEIIMLIKSNDYYNSLGKSKEEIYADWVKSLRE